MQGDPFKPGVLKPDVHARLVQEIDSIAAAAMIHPKWICAPLANTAPPKVVEWVRTFKRNYEEGISGLALTGAGKVSQSVNTCSAIAGALIRNFVNAQVMMEAQLFEQGETSHGVADPTCLLIPNFYTGVDLAQWRVHALQEVLYDRHMRGRATVIYVTNINEMAAKYGSATAELIRDNYAIVPLTGEV